MALPVRRIGPFEVSAIGLGCMNLSHAYGVPPGEAEGVALLNRALDLGCTLFDTAALYGDGDNERLLGKAIMHRRAEFTLASKCVLDFVDGKRVLDGRPGTIRATCEAALKRLGTEVIDLYYLHRLDRAVPIEESMGAMGDLVAAGKIRTVGLSEMSAATIARAHAVHPVTAVQSEYSVVVRNPEVAVLGVCRKLAITFVPFSPVARGLLAGGVSADHYAEGDIRRNMPRFVEPRLTANLALVAPFHALAREVGCTSAQLALGWLLAQDGGLVPIPGTRSIAHLEENLASATIALDPQTVAATDALLPVNVLHGARYAAGVQRQIDTETLQDEELA